MNQPSKSRLQTTHLLYIVLVIGVAVWWMMSRSGGPEAEIRERLERMEQLMVKEAGESALDSADRARRFAAFLDDPFLLRREPIGQEISDSAALARPFVGLRRQIERLDVSFSNIDIEVVESGRRATSVMDVALNATGQNPRRGRYEVTIRWRKDGDWLVEDLHVVEARGLL